MAGTIPLTRPTAVRIRTATISVTGLIIKRMSPAKLALKPELSKLKEFASAGWIPWNRVYSQPDYVFFSHRRHVVVAKLDCANCHGDMGSLSSPPIRPAVDQSMDWCMNCHQQRQASTDCVSCHK